MARRLVTLDVFTTQPLTGNPLAVVLDGDGLEAERMQAIAREMNLSETVFVRQGNGPGERADIRIFTPTRELPFAGHPTVGTAVLLALIDRNGERGHTAFGLKERIGVIPCEVEVTAEDSGRASFRLPRLPNAWGEGRSIAEAAQALGLAPHEIGFDGHRPSRHSAGVAYDLVPVASLDALARAKPEGEAFTQAFGGSDHPAAYVYTRQTMRSGRCFRARMFAPDMGISEDPATGSAAAAFVGALMDFEGVGDGEHSVVIEQGFEMGRPSEIMLKIVVSDSVVQSAEISGGAVIVSRGELFL